MKKILFIAIIALVSISCNKNQRAVKKLSGKWEATKFATTDSSGTTTDYIGLINVTYEFDNCKLKNDEYCNMTTTTTTNIFGVSTSTTENNMYRVIDEGVTLEVKNDSTTNTITIVELTKKNLKVKQVENNTTLEIEATKVK
jgi:hypothetical protein